MADLCTTILYGCAGSGMSEPFSWPRYSLSLLPSRFWNGRAFMAATLAASAALSSGSDRKARSRSGAIAWRSTSPTAASTDPLSRGRLGRAGTTAQP